MRPAAPAGRDLAGRGGRGGTSSSTSTEADGVTTVTFSPARHRPGRRARASGPGWEYYLDRLVPRSTAATSAVDFEADYYPAMPGTTAPGAEGYPSGRTSPTPGRCR